MKKYPLLILSIILIWCSLALLYAVDSYGKSRRTLPRAGSDLGKRPSVVLLKDSKDVYSLWKKYNCYGLQALQIGRYLHFMPIGDDGVLAFKGGSRRTGANIIAEYEKNVTNKNFLWVALQANVLREVFYVLPQDIFADKLRKMEVASHGKADFSNKLVFDEFGWRRTLMTHMPSMQEPFLANVDASFFASGDAAGLLHELTVSKSKIVLITFCLSESNPEVTDNDRIRLKEFMNLVRNEL